MPAISRDLGIPERNARVVGQRNGREESQSECGETRSHAHSHSIVAGGFDEMS
jgi:hypothetical protein